MFCRTKEFNIICSDRKIKNMIDNYYKKSYCKAVKEIEYKRIVESMVSQSINYYDNLKAWIKEEYENHCSDFSCDIPDWKTFLSLEKEMLDNPDEHRNKSTCIEGYVAYGCIDSTWIYPVPCRNKIEKESAYILTDYLRAFYPLLLIGDKAKEINNTLDSGTHIRVHGLTSPRRDYDNVPIIVNKYEIIE